MTKITEFIRKRRLFIFISAIIIPTLLIFFVLKNEKKPTISITTTTPVPNDKTASFNNIVPGETSQERINELLGFPLNTEDKDGKTFLDYKTSNQYRNHTIVIKNGIVILIKEIVNKEDNINADIIREKYGVAPNILYEQKFSSTFDLYVYPGNGIAYLGHQDGTILEVWYFQPTDIDNFIESWANNYQKEEFKEYSKY